MLPVKRAKTLLISGNIDFHLPVIYSRKISEELTVAYVSEPVADVAFVLYTRADETMLPRDGLAGFHIETIRGGGAHLPFRVWGIDSVKQGILRVIYGRSDGFISEQDAVDLFIRKNKIKNIRRTLYANLKSAIMIRKGVESEELDQILSRSLRILKQKGELQRITDTIHRPFEDWQPYLMNWADTK